MNSLRLLDLLFNRPILNVGLARDELKVAFQTANAVVEQIENLGLLREMTGAQRNRRYAYLPYLEIFAEPSDGLALDVPSRRRSPRMPPPWRTRSDVMPASPRLRVLRLWP